MDRPPGTDDDGIVAAQLGRPPRTPWRVAVRCPHGFPRVIASPSRLDDGEPFPTTFWLSCPTLLEAVGRAESEGGVAEWEKRLRTDLALAEQARTAEASYRVARAFESGGEDRCGDVGIGGVADPARVKCLHARVAAWLAGMGDPVGEGVLRSVPNACGDGRCARLLAPIEGAD